MAKLGAIVTVGILLCGLLLVGGALAAPISSGYRLDWLVPLTGGGGSASGGGYAVSFTVGQSAIGASSSGSYRAGLGYWAPAYGMAADTSTPTPTATPTLTPPASATPTPTPPVSATPTATATAGPRRVLVPSFTLDVSASAGEGAVSLGRALELHNLFIQEGELPGGTVSWSDPVAGTSFSADLTLAVTSFDPLVVSLQRFRIALPSGQAADIASIGTVPIAVPGTADFTRSAAQSVARMGSVTFTFTGQAQTTLP